MICHHWNALLRAYIEQYACFFAAGGFKGRNDAICYAMTSDLINLQCSNDTGVLIFMRLTVVMILKIWFLWDFVNIIAFLI